ncbi:growth arrest-specific protein 7 isoform X1 [Sigmodon hispidus]
MAGARCRTLYPFSGERHSQGLRFAAGELLTLLQVPDGGWWEGEKDDGLRGWFPASYVQLLESLEHVVAARGKGELVACTSSGASRRAAEDDRGRQGAAERGGLGKEYG